MTGRPQAKRSTVPTFKSLPAKVGRANISRRATVQTFPHFPRIGGPPCKHFLPSPHSEKGQKGPTCKHFGRLRECWYGGPIARNVGPVDHFEEKWSNRATVPTFLECWHVGHITKMLGRPSVEQFYKAHVQTFPRRIRAVRRANISRVSSKRATVQTFSRFRECWHVGLVRGKRRKCLHVGHCVADVPTFF